MERDYPIGHPASSDYAGQKYTPPRAPWMDDFPEDHPAHGGRNCNETDSPDGQRANLLAVEQDVAELAAVGAIPVDREKEAEVLAADASPYDKAMAFLESRGYTKPAAETLIQNVGVERILQASEEK